MKLGLFLSFVIGSECIGFFFLLNDNCWRKIRDMEIVKKQVQGIGSLVSNG